MGTIKGCNVSNCIDYFKSVSKYEVLNIVKEYDALREKLMDAKNEKNSVCKSSSDKKAKEANYKRALEEYNKGYKRLKECIEKNITDDKKRKPMFETF